MAKQFSVWVDDDNITHVQSGETFANDEQRKSGFIAGTGASAIRANTALRQANLISVAFMNALSIPVSVDSQYDLSVKSKVEDVKDWISRSELFKTTELFDTYNRFIKLSLRPRNDAIDLGDDRLKFNNIYAKNVHADNILGTGMKGKDTDKPPLQGYDKAKGTIEERLKDLGFKSGVITFAGRTYGSDKNTDTTLNGVFRQGNYVFGKINAIETYTDTETIKYFSNNKIVFSVPDEFKPKINSHVKLVMTRDGAKNFGRVSDVIIYNDTGLAEILNMTNLTSGDWSDLGGTAIISLNFGYEVRPIE